MEALLKGGRRAAAAHVAAAAKGPASGYPSWHHLGASQNGSVLRTLSIRKEYEGIKEEAGQYCLESRSCSGQNPTCAQDFSALLARTIGDNRSPKRMQDRKTY